MDHIWYDEDRKTHYAIKGNGLYRRTTDVIGNSYWKAITDNGIFNVVQDNEIILSNEIRRLASGTK